MDLKRDMEDLQLEYAHIHTKQHVLVESSDIEWQMRVLDLDSGR